MEGVALGVAELSQMPAAGLDLGVRDPVREIEGGRPRARGKGEDVEVGQGQGLYQFTGVAKRLIALPREADQDVRSDGRVRHGPVDELDRGRELPGSVGTSHALQDVRIAALQGDVEVAAKPPRPGDPCNQVG